jgi:hypothetical protein
MATAPRSLHDAYRRWLAAQEQALEIMESAAQPGTEQDWAEGYRWLTRIASLCQDWILEKEDPLHPTIFRSQGEARKLMVDNPDVDYWFSSLDAQRTYRLSGSRGAAPYIGLSVGTDVFRGAVEGARTGTLVQSNVDRSGGVRGGVIELFLAPDREHVPEGAAWVELPPGATQLSVRETFTDRSQQRPSELKIELVGSVAPPRAEPEVIAEKLDTMSRFLLFVANTCGVMWRGAAANTNRLRGAPGRKHVEAQADENRTHSDADMVYMGGKWLLADDEALEITIHPPSRPFVYWGLVIINPWMESYDYRSASTCFSNGTAQPNADGSWTLTIAPNDPGGSNWLDTGGRREGYMLLRWVLADNVPDPTCVLRRL